MDSPTHIPGVSTIELIDEILDEMGERTAAKRVRKILSGIEEAQWPVLIKGREINEVNLQVHGDYYGCVSVG